MRISPERSAVIRWAVFAGVLLACGAKARADFPATQPSGHGSFIVAGQGVSAPATTQPSGESTAGDQPHERKQPLIRLLESLNLSPSQWAQIKPVLEAFHQQVEAFRSERQTEIANLQAAVKTAHQTGDTSAIRTAMQQMHTLRQSAPKLKDLLAQIRALLTPEQQGVFDQEVAELEATMHGEHGQGGPGGPGGMAGQTSGQTGTLQAGAGGITNAGVPTTQPAGQDNVHGGQFFHRQWSEANTQ